jgi:hypothetical protein
MICLSCGQKGLADIVISKVLIFIGVKGQKHANLNRSFAITIQAQVVWYG